MVLDKGHGAASNHLSLESVSYEDAVRNAISLGGDADTLAAIASAIAETMPSKGKQKTATPLRAYVHSSSQKKRWTGNPPLFY